MPSTISASSLACSAMSMSSHRTDHDVALQRVELLVYVVIDDPRGFAQQLAVLGLGHVVVDEDDVAQAPARVERHRVEIVGENDGVHVHADVVQEPRGVASQGQVFARARHVRHRESQLALRFLFVVPPVEIAGDGIWGIPVHPLVVDARTSRHVRAYVMALTMESRSAPRCPSRA